MQIVSTNIGEPVTIEWKGKKLQTGIYKYAVETSIFLGEQDVENDHVMERRYHGGSNKACYLYSADHYSFWKNRYPNQEWSWGMFGENLTIEGLNESEVRIGDRFRIGAAEVQVSQPRQPCFKLGIRFGDQAVVEDFWESGFPGIYVRVLKPGAVRKGDLLNLIERNPESLSVTEVFSIFSRNRKNLDLIQKAIAEPFLAESCRRDIQKIIETSK